MPAPDNLMYQKFGKLLVIQNIGKIGHSHNRHWKCLCDCGRYEIVRGSVLKTCKYNKCKYCKRNRHVGDKFNRLSIKQVLNKRIKGQIETFYLCECECGREREIQSSSFRTATECLYCYIMRKQNRSKSKYINYNAISGAYWSNIINGAKARQLEFNITQEYAWNIFLKQEGKCALSGINLCFRKSLSTKDKLTQTASLDRIDSNKGYIEGNIQWVHKKFQRMKMKMNQQQFIEYCTEVAEYNNELNFY